MVTISQRSKIIFFGNQQEAYSFLNQALSHQEIQLEHYNLNELDRLNSNNLDFQLVILDIGDAHFQKMGKISSYIKNLHRNSIPSLALIPEKEV